MILLVIQICGDLEFQFGCVAKLVINNGCVLEEGGSALSVSKFIFIQAGNLVLRVFVW